MEMEQFLPVEIITKILSRLPVDSVIQCKRVCKTWRALTDDPVFVAAHTHRFISSSSSDQSNNSDSPAPLLFLSRNGDTCKYEFIEYNYDNNPIPLKRCPFILESDSRSNGHGEFSSSCNGLVFMCFVFTEYNNMLVCNPACTREYVNLVPSLLINTTSDDENNTQVYFGNAYGFGYHPHTREYKIVIISYHNNNEPFCYGQVIVYTLGRSGRWRNKGKLPNLLLSGVDSVMILNGPGVLVNGVLHWIVENPGKEIVLFDLEDEEFRLLPSPPRPSQGGTQLESIGLFAGCLCATRFNYDSESSDIWVMKKKNTWTMELSIPWKTEEDLYCLRCLFACLKRGKILLLSGFQHLVSYDPETDSFQKNETSLDDYMDWCTFIPYEKSFVSLKALGEKDSKYVSV